MKKKIIIAVILLILLFPIKFNIRDGGSKGYKALAYTITRVHKLVPESETNEYVKPYKDGWEIKLFGFKIFDNVK